MSDDTVKGSRRLNSANTPVNAIAFLVEQEIKRQVNTAEIMAINSADAQGKTSPGGRAKATPLIAQTDGWGNSLPTTAIPNLPFYRPQAGKAAIIMEPQPGDKAIAVFTKRDSSALAVGKNEAAPPATHRAFDQADGFLINGILGVEPEIWLRLDPASGEISLSTKAANLEITCRESGDIDIKTGAGKFNIEATAESTIKAPSIILDGNVRITGTLTVDNGSGGQNRMTGGFINTGGVVSSNGVTLETHTHTGVQPGGGSTGSPNGGS